MESPLWLLPGFNKYGGEGDVLSLAFFKVTFILLPIYDGCHVGFYKGGNMWRGLLGHKHVVRDKFSHLSISMISDCPFKLTFGDGGDVADGVFGAGDSAFSLACEAILSDALLDI